ncbi:phenylalanine--tRNA ligase subunit beta [Paenarthrobacter aurescens]|uniref:Phenylalanine--tRNA ligase beta subunit n=1 Tax=Paenarthrobacter aurescens TaxID=43663 RepID=A0A4Y3NKU9_PAEAU|nr:phenylalanine--tRNA ligase subunit beta [Paenarthrobacter aurescens]MDO6143139.1 phenylalanine--tRNA ligase subunit beta [Paenarthrobacter aurescens]MDO6146985.1 phenylalanine--tRNA ligase subunit beta [Paenarthrobacter aurescens]MDO6158231.1 phenylalanine--tRNA ligase subunit beta [Paenarthrobacter aurescens]MDO6162215.1 phenylalanine--tRNA ligase subunit beta [Paenarthrobacter aurescens]GEB19698.1 phenylalanine--tRNA ligase beta subunit [Paenarthrobacter aurescens]
MRIPLSWLREFAQVPADATAEDVMADLVKVGFEEEEVHRPTDELTGPVVVGQVLSLVKEPQTNGKTINWCQVRVVPEGQEQTLTGEGIDPSGVQGIICGAHNFVEGDKVVVTLPGAVLPGNFQISARKTYGHLSAGMIASVRELGIGDDHDGILVLSRIGLDPEIGSDAMELLGLYDQAAEINVTPDRGYAFSIRGVAREYAHATGTSFTDPTSKVNAPASLQGGYGVKLNDDAPIYGKPGCDRFVARTVRGVDASRPTPPWMSSRLRLAGIRSISLPVDISNYVMLELGQPNHCYDLDKLSGDIVVRRAVAGEKITTLDDKERTLDVEDLLITDDSGAIGIAGVMGGAHTEVSDSTTNILVEAAHFDEVSIARSRRRHKLPSEASKRFERGVDWHVAHIAAQRVVDLLVELAGGVADEAGTDVGTAPDAVTIELPAKFASARIGIDFTEEQITTSLEDLGAVVEKTTSGYTVTAPSWRNDLETKEDLSEEIARLVGYDNIPSTLPVAPPGRGLSRTQQQKRRVVQALADAGLTEVLSYPFVSKAANDTFGVAAEGAARPALKLANPISEEHGYLRTSILPGLIEVARRNHSRGFRDLAVYEAGSVFLPGETLGTDSIPPLGVKPADEVLDALYDGVPHQPLHIAAVLTGHDSPAAATHTPRAWDWADALDVARLIADVLGVELVVSQGSHQAFHPGRAAQLALRNGEVVGYAGELHPKLLAAQDMPARSVALEVNVEALFEAAADVIVAKHISGFPVATQDVALVVPQDVPADQVLAALREGAGELLEDVALFDVYAGPGIDEGKKSLAFGLRFRADDRTLTADEASEARAAAVAVAAERFGAVQR